MTRSARFRILLFVLTLTVGGATGDAAEIQFLAQAETRGSLVLLGDIARVQDPDPQQVDALRRIELFPAPARGRVRSMETTEIRQLLQLHGVRTADHRFSGADQVTIGCSQPEKKTFQPTPAKPSPDKVNQTLVVSRSAIPAGTLLREMDVELQEVVLPPGKASTAAKTVESVIGLETTRTLTPGQVIDSHSLRKPILVRRGDLVSVVAKAAGVRVRTTAKALSDAVLGDLLPVESANRDKFSVVVTGPKQAEIFASGISATTLR